MFEGLSFRMPNIDNKLNDRNVRLYSATRLGNSFNTDIIALAILVTTTDRVFATLKTNSLAFQAINEL